MKYLYKKLIKWKEHLKKKSSWQPLENLKSLQNLVKKYGNFYEIKEENNTILLEEDEMPKKQILKFTIIIKNI